MCVCACAERSTADNGPARNAAGSSAGAGVEANNGASLSVSPLSCINTCILLHTTSVGAGVEAMNSASLSCVGAAALPALSEDNEFLCTTREYSREGGRALRDGVLFPIN